MNLEVNNYPLNGKRTEQLFLINFHRMFKKSTDTSICTFMQLREFLYKELPFKIGNSRILKMDNVGKIDFSLRKKFLLMNEQSAVTF